MGGGLAFDRPGAAPGSYRLAVTPVMLHSCTANALHKKYIILKIKNPCAGSTPGTWLFNGRKMTMENFIPIGKMSRKARRKIEHSKRNTWGTINPITRRAESKKIYNRKKVRPEKNDFGEVKNGAEYEHPKLSNQAAKPLAA